jgi:hypothetical protein
MKTSISVLVVMIVTTCAQAGWRAECRHATRLCRQTHGASLATMPTTTPTTMPPGGIDCSFCITARCASDGTCERCTHFPPNSVPEVGSVDCTKTPTHPCCTGQPLNCADFSNPESCVALGITDPAACLAWWCTHVLPSGHGCCVPH